MRKLNYLLIITFMLVLAGCEQEDVQMPLSEDAIVGIWESSDLNADDEKIKLKFNLDSTGERVFGEVPFGAEEAFHFTWRIESDVLVVLDEGEETRLPASISSDRLIFHVHEDGQEVNMIFERVQ